MMEFVFNVFTTIILALITCFLLLGIYFGVTVIYDDIKDRMKQRGVRK